MRLVSRTLKIMTALFVLLLSVVALAQEEVKDEKAIYIPLKPPFVVNYGGVGRLKYLKAEISVRVNSSDAANSVRHHLPYIRNNLVLLFSKQSDVDLDSQEGKEALRQQALAEILSIVETEDGETGIVDLYFENFVVQR
ncbi:hypothetical protein NBRC116493_29370 [Aurantivibrio infirmus]